MKKDLKKRFKDSLKSMMGSIFYIQKASVNLDNPKMLRKHSFVNSGISKGARDLDQQSIVLTKDYREFREEAVGKEGNFELNTMYAILWNRASVYHLDITNMDGH